MSRPFQILLVDDNPGDVDLVLEALNEGTSRKSLYVINDGGQAIGFLRREGKYAQMPLPDLILLDLNLPRMDGRDVLEQIKTDDGLKHIPVVVLSSSQDEKDVLRSYRLHANCYVSKRLWYDELKKTVQAIEELFLNTATLPRAE